MHGEILYIMINLSTCDHFKAKVIFEKHNNPWNERKRVCSESKKIRKILIIKIGLLLSGWIYEKSRSTFNYEWKTEIYVRK